jgi:CopG family nickel-responsive transcriptional regulator
MSDLVRLSISLEKSLLRKLDRLVKASRYTNRSEFVRDLIRGRLVEGQWEDDDQEVLGTITLLYDHHVRDLTERSVDIQHHHHQAILATTHIHLSHDLCAEMIMVRGPARQVRRIAGDLQGQRGVLHADLSMSSTGRSLR